MQLMIVLSAEAALNLETEKRQTQDASELTSFVLVHKQNGHRRMTTAE
jgi:hypothetical protein